MFSRGSFNHVTNTLQNAGLVVEWMITNYFSLYISCLLHSFNFVLWTLRKFTADSRYTSAKDRGLFGFDSFADGRIAFALLSKSLVPSFHVSFDISGALFFSGAH